MKNMIMIPILLLMYGCGSEPELNCGCDSETVEVMENVRGIIRLYNDLGTGEKNFYYIDIEDGKLNPTVISCEKLSKEFEIDGLNVILNGEWKLNCPGGPDPTSKYFNPHPFKVSKILTINN